MTTEISQSLPYEPLKPIEVEQEGCPLTCKILRIFFNVIALSAFGIAFGVAIALQCSATILSGGLLGGVIGVALGIALSILQKRDTPAMKYRVQTLEQVEKTQSLPKVLEAIQKIKEVVKEDSFCFEQAFDNHAFHRHATIVIDAIGERPDIQKVWRGFLEHMDGQMSHYPSGAEIKLDFSLDLARLDGQLINYQVEEIAEKDFEELEELQMECFDKGTTWPKDRMQKHLALGYVARSESSGAILGFVWTKKREDTHHIMGLGRRAGACRLGIGEILMCHLLERCGGKEVVLQIRASNLPALRLYEKLGFEESGNTSDYYSYPSEDAIEMKLNWSKYQPMEDVI